MDYCTIKNSQKGQTLQKASGLPETLAYTYITAFEKSHGRFPELDEIPYANSEEYLNNLLDIKQIRDTKYTTILKVQDLTGANNSHEATVKINLEHPDLEVHLNRIGNTVTVETLHRPTAYLGEEITPTSIDFDNTRESNSIILRDSLNRLLKYYGILTNAVSISELPEGFSEAKAFIKDGQIYINTDKATIDSPVHELLHLFMGSVRFANPQLYYSLVLSVEQLPNFELLAELFPNRAMSDVQEEIFVHEVANYVTKQPSLLDSIEAPIVDKLFYYINRDIDSILMGKQSVRTLNGIYGKSLLELAEETGSENFDIDTAGTLDDATIHRIMANTKEDLMNKNELILNCR